ncbi:dihydrolipoyl dehydrogenase [Parahaliea aestuarii]|uniref:Dihydrolipoyl dehydrogenase n=1 Tax=Parahaliea aestuarii TaxID=1852021 RepID=A0A5C9A666_9GAMM|nr:dihydrolipoyl dehydrogenase [Parahaliea aestuarii]TXS95047.1 dihydrolipoyl dehydrogenase [Parahaliea aestuarii]
MKQTFDLVVVGSGPGGYIAAVRAAQLGFKTALIEKDRLGGVCLNWGCIPTKALLRGAELAHNLRHAATFGIQCDGAVDLEQLVKHSRTVAGKLSGGIGYLMKKNGITVIEGSARVSGKCQLAVTAGDGTLTDIAADHIVLATGAHARELPTVRIDGEHIWGAREAMTPTHLPRRLLIIGAGAIGVEFASLYSDLGSEVTLVEALPRILPAEDADSAAFVHREFSRRGITIHTDARVESASPGSEGVEVRFRHADERAETLTVDRVILAVGVAGNVDNLGLEDVGAHIERGFIVTDEWCRTNVVGLYAIGDVAGPPWLAHKASHEAVLCVEKIAGLDSAHPLDADNIPGCTYSRPQVASVGLTETEAKAGGRAVKVGRFDLGANGKALAIDEASGFVKTLFDSATGELLGAHMVGPEVTEQIQGFALARSMEATEADLMRAVFPHPTLSEAMHESVLDAYDSALNQ